MPFRRSLHVFTCLCLVVLLAGCSSWGSDNSVPPRVPTATALPPTPSEQTLRVSGAMPGTPHLRVTIPSVQLLRRPADASAQLFAVLADPVGTYSYLLYPANRSGDLADTFDLTAYPLEISLEQASSRVFLWLLAVHTPRYIAAESFGLEALTASLGFGLRNWLAAGDLRDDPLAAIVNSSEGALYEWFATVQVLGQVLIPLETAPPPVPAPVSQRSADGGLSLVYTVEPISAATVSQDPTPTEQAPQPGYALIAEENFAGARSEFVWFQGQDATYTNQITDGAYEIRLTSIEQREFGLSWGSIEGQRFEDYLVEAQVQLVEEDVVDARYGIWFNYQDDYNFIYFGISNQGAYRAAVIQRNRNRIELQDWTPHPIIRRGAATNTLTVASTPQGDITLGVNGETLAVFNNPTFTSGSIAFFCYAESVPATCRLERLRIWERIG